MKSDVLKLMADFCRNLYAPFFSSPSLPHRHGA